MHATFCQTPTANESSQNRLRLLMLYLIERIIYAIQKAGYHQIERKSQPYELFRDGGTDFGVLGFQQDF